MRRETSVSRRRKQCDLSRSHHLQGHCHLKVTVTSSSQGHIISMLHHFKVTSTSRQKQNEFCSTKTCHTREVRVVAEAIKIDLLCHRETRHRKSCSENNPAFIQKKNMFCFSGPEFCVKTPRIAQLFTRKESFVFQVKVSVAKKERLPWRRDTRGLC